MIDKDRNVSKFLEELSWLLSSYSNLDFKKITKYLASFENQSNFIFEDKDINENIHYLIGVLPKLLLNEKIFKSNSDIAEFAENVLGLKINRYDKISKYEIIGHIVCNVSCLEDEKFRLLVKALRKIKSDDKKIEELKVNSNNFSWNKMIQEMLYYNE